MNVIELNFPAIGETVPSDHGYALFGGLSRIAPSLHGAESPVRIGPIRGVYAGNGILNLDRRFSAVRLRLPADQIALALPLAGQALDIAGHRVRLGVPQVHALIPAVNLLARMVVIKSVSPRDAATNIRSKALAKRGLDPAAFLEAAQRKLAALDIQANAAIPLALDGP
ncbi:MAG: type I-MYXAN CRISPR-associated protein Cas6/Cmx6, partial [Planctomycetota bacterium]